MNTELICSVCGGADPLLINTQVGLTIMCGACIKLGKESQKEIDRLGEPNVYCPESFKDKPATCKLFLHAYFKLNPQALKYPN